MVALITKSVNEQTHYYLQILAHLNIMINPILYVLLNRGYRAAIQKGWHRLWSRRSMKTFRRTISNSISLGTSLTICTIEI